MTSPGDLRRPPSATSWSAERDRWAFFWFVAGGIFLILVLKWAQMPGFIVTLTPCFVMLAYAYILWDFSEQRPRPGASGDNLYYLGFLYTLTSLAHSLYNFSGGQLDAENIVSNFGIAVATTILGMALRVIMAPPEDGGPAALEAAARADLGATARKLRAELVYCVDAFRETIEKDLKGFRDVVGEARAEIRSDLVALREQLAEDASRTQEISSHMIRRAQALDSAVVRFEAGAGRVDAALQSRVRDLQRSAAPLEAVGRSVAALQGRVEAFGNAIDAHSTGLEAGSSKVVQALEGQARDIRDVILVNVIRGAVEPATQGLREVLEEFRVTVGSLQKAQEAREQAAAGSAKATEALVEALARQQDVANAIVEVHRRSRGISLSLRNASDQIERHAGAVETVTDQVASVRDGLLQSAKQIRVANELLERTRVSLEANVRAAEQLLQASGWHRRRDRLIGWLWPGRRRRPDRDRGKRRKA